MRFVVTSQDIGVESQTLSKYGDRLVGATEGILPEREGEDVDRFAGLPRRKPVVSWQGVHAGDQRFGCAAVVSVTTSKRGDQYMTGVHGLF